MRLRIVAAIRQLLAVIATAQKTPIRVTTQGKLFHARQKILLAHSHRPCCDRVCDVLRRIGIHTRS